MGDSGIYLYSFTISLFFIHFYNERSIIYADTIFLMMMVPGIDMFRLFIRILKNKILSKLIKIIFIIYY